MPAIAPKPGPTGPTGPSGPASTVPGPTGASGSQGPSGPSGPQGIQGVQGDPGPSGPSGSQGIQGPSGPSGSQGIQGPSGPSGSAATVTAGTTTTGAAGTSAAVTNSGTSSAAVFDFTIPQGNVGASGSQGPSGPSGPSGSAATVTAGTTTTGIAGSSASVTNSGTSSAAVFDFTIPRGDTGSQGPSGPSGPSGSQGPSGSAATVAAGTITTGAPGTSASVTNSGTSSAAVFDFTIPRGDVGATGPTGIGATGATGPSGSISGISAGGDLTGTYPDPTVGAGKITGTKLGPVPYAELRRLSNYSLADNSFVSPSGSAWTDTAFDNGVATTGTALASTTTGRITLRRTGMWMITASVAWGNSGTGWRSIAIYWSDMYGAPAAQDVNSQGFGSIFGFTSTISTVVMCTSTASYITLSLYQNSGASMTLNPFYLKAVWLGNNS